VSTVYWQVCDACKVKSCWCLHCVCWPCLYLLSPIALVLCQTLSTSISKVVFTPKCTWLHDTEMMSVVGGSRSGDVISANKPPFTQLIQSGGLVNCHSTCGTVDHPSHAPFRWTCYACHKGQKRLSIGQSFVCTKKQVGHGGCKELFQELSLGRFCGLSRRAVSMRNRQLVSMALFVNCSFVGVSSARRSRPRHWSCWQWCGQVEGTYSRSSQVTWRQRRLSRPGVHEVCSSCVVWLT